MPPAPPPSLSGTQRAAVLLVALGVENARRLLPELSDTEVERVTVEVARLQSVPGSAVEAVLSAYRAAAATPTPPTARGGLDAARTFLREGLDEARAGAILPRVEAATEGTGFDLLGGVEADRLAAFLAGEHPQTAAVVLSRVKARKAADTLALLPDIVRADVVRRLTDLADPAPAVLRDLDAALRAAFGAAPDDRPSGAKRAADILTQASRETGRAVLEALQAQNPSLAEEIEGLLFVFEDLNALSGRDLARVLAGVDQGVLARALRGADEAFKTRVFDNVSERVAASLQEEIELSGPVRVSEVEDAQRSVVEAALALAETGEISLGAEEEDTADLV